MSRVQEVSQDHNNDLEVEGIVINQFQAGARLPNETVTGLKAAGFTILEPYLSTSVAMRESHGVGMPLIYYKPKHKLTQEFEALAERLLEHSRAGARAKTWP